MSEQLDQQCVNTIRFLSLDMVQKADSGHPGLPLGAAPMAYVLWTRWLKYNPDNPDWVDRDRFVLSMGHASMLLYSLLHLTEVRAVSKDYETLAARGNSQILSQKTCDLGNVLIV